jgi:hypothetical protein
VVLLADCCTCPYQDFEIYALYYLIAIQAEFLCLIAVRQILLVSTSAAMLWREALMPGILDLYTATPYLVPPLSVQDHEQPEQIRNNLEAKNWELLKDANSFTAGDSLETP